MFMTTVEWMKHAALTHILIRIQCWFGLNKLQLLAYTFGSKNVNKLISENYKSLVGFVL